MKGALFKSWERVFSFSEHTVWSAQLSLSNLHVIVLSGSRRKILITTSVLNVEKEFYGSEAVTEINQPINFIFFEKEMQGVSTKNVPL